MTDKLDVGRIKEGLPNSHLKTGPKKGMETEKIKVLSGAENVDAVYICNKLSECEYTNTNYASVVSHMASHTRRGEVERNQDSWHQAPSRRSRAAMTSEWVASLMKLAEDIESSTMVTGEWKARALRAEKRLKDIEAAVSKLGLQIGGH